MRKREAPIVLGRAYRLPSGNLVRVEHDLGGGALACQYDCASLSASEHMFSLHPAGEVWLSERFIAKHAWGPLR